MKITIIGQGGHSKVIRDLILNHEGYQLVGYLDDKYSELKRLDDLYYGPILAAYELISKHNDMKFIIAIGNNSIRQSIVSQLSLKDSNYITLIHKSASVSPTAVIGTGTVVLANAVINADAQIGNHVIINSGSIVEHDNSIGSFAHICPRATLTGTVTIGEGVMIGAGATVIPSVSIAEWSQIGAGSTVIHDMPAQCKAVGSPAKIKHVN